MFFHNFMRITRINVNKQVMISVVPSRVNFLVLQSECVRVIVRLGLS